MNKLELRIRSIITVYISTGYTIKELETRSELGYATIWRLLHYFDTEPDDRHRPRKTTLKTLEFVLGLDR